MFPWFKPRCTVDVQTRGWIERRWRWLGEQFPEVLLDSQNVLPTADFFPDPFQPNDESVQTLVRRVCGYMNVAPDLIDLQFFSKKGHSFLVNDDGHPISAGPAGTYHEDDRRFVIRIERSQFHNPMDLVGTVAHELAHVLLLGERRLDREVFDNELLTDLTVVYHGLGIFLANSPRHWDAHMKKWPDTDLVRPEYMTTPMYGYALATRCWLREEPYPQWARHLRSAPRAEFKAALRFLNHSVGQARRRGLNVL